MHYFMYFLPEIVLLLAAADIRLLLCRFYITLSFFIIIPVFLVLFFVFLPVLSDYSILHFFLFVQFIFKHNII